MSAASAAGLVHPHQIDMPMKESMVWMSAMLCHDVRYAHTHTEFEFSKVWARLSPLSQSSSTSASRLPSIAMTMSTTFPMTPHPCLVSPGCIHVHMYWYIWMHQYAYMNVSACAYGRVSMHIWTYQHAHMDVSAYMYRHINMHVWMCQHA